MTGSEIFTLLLYLVQQLGVMLGVGAAIITLIAHLVSTRDGVVEPAEARFARAIERVLMVGLFCMIASGVFITALHSTAGQAVIIFTPAFVFKWILIGVVSLPLIVGHKHPFPPLWFEGFVGGTWLALFALHVVAPIATWTSLVFLYAVWLLVFFIIWTVLAKMLHAHDPVYKHHRAPALAVAGGPILNSLVAPVLAKPVQRPVVQVPPQTPPKQPPPPPPVVPAPPPPPAPKPEVPPQPKPLPTPPPPAIKIAVMPPPPKPAVVVVPVKLPQKPDEKVADPDTHPNLPAIRVMPRTIEDIENHERASVVNFS